MTYSGLGKRWSDGSVSKGPTGGRYGIVVGKAMCDALAVLERLPAVGSVGMAAALACIDTRCVGGTGD